MDLLAHVARLACSMQTALTVRAVLRRIVLREEELRMAKAPARQARTSASSRTSRQVPVRGAVARAARTAVMQVLHTNVEEVVAILAATGTIREVSPSVTRVLGHAPEALSGQESAKFIHPDDHASVQEALAAVLRDPHHGKHYACRLRHQDGTWRPVAGTLTNLLHNPVVTGIVMTARDLTERQVLEVALRESEERYRHLVELSPEPLLVHVNEQIAYVNAACVALFGARTVEELLGQSIWDVLHPDSVDVIRQRLHQIRTEGRAPLLQEITLRRLDGSFVDVEVAGAAIHFHGQPAVQAVLREVGERRRAEEAQRATEESYRDLFENANDAIATFNVDGIISSVNRGTELLLGWTREELVRHSYHNVLTPAAQVLADARTQRFLAGEALPSIFEIDFVHKDGHIIPVEARTRPIRNRAGQVIAFQGIYRDMTERKRAEAALRESQQLLERIADTLPELLYLYERASGRLLYCNRRVTAMLGYTPAEIEGQALTALREFVHPDDQDRLATRDQQIAQATDDAHVVMDYRVRHRNGAYRWLQVRERVCTRTDSGEPARIVGLATDITVHKQVRTLADKHRILRQEIPERLRKFRERLGYTQAEFGRRFGGLNQRQIGSYETGVAEPSLTLLLAIQEHGYPLSSVLGTERDALVDATLHHLTRGHSRHALIEQLAEVVRQLAAQERETMAHVVHELGLEPVPLTTAEREALAHASRLPMRRSDPE